MLSMTFSIVIDKSFWKCALVSTLRPGAYDQKMSYFCRDPCKDRTSSIAGTINLHHIHNILFHETKVFWLLNEKYNFSFPLVFEATSKSFTNQRKYQIHFYSREWKEYLTCWDSLFPAFPSSYMKSLWIFFSIKVSLSSKSSISSPSLASK